MPVIKPKPLTDDEKSMQQQLLLESELRSLTRGYQSLEQGRTRRIFSGELNIERGLKVFNIFKNEHLNLLTDLSVATGAEKTREDQKILDRLSALLNDNTYFSNRVKTEKTYMKELEDEIKQVQRDVQSLRKQQITDRQYEDRVWNAFKTVEALENKLEVQMKKFNVICAKNRELREQINHHLWNRKNFLVMWQKFIDKLSFGKKVMLDLIEQATIAYDQREEWCKRLQVLRLKAHRDLTSNVQEMRELKRKGDHAKKMEDFFYIKGQKRVMQDLELKEKMKRRELKKKLKEKFQKLEVMMEEILEFTRESKIDIIAKKYYQQEEENFTNFKFINDMMLEMESVSDRLGFLHLDIEESNALHEERTTRQQDNIENLESDLDNATKECEEAKKQLENVEAELSSIMEGIWKLFKLCRCDNDPLLKLLGDNTIIHDHNVNFYLEILESQIQKYVLQAAYTDKIHIDKRKITHDQRIISDQQSITNIYPIEKIVLSSPCSLCVEHEMVSDVLDTLQKVWDRYEAKKKLRMRLLIAENVNNVHNISDCHLPRARQLIQKRYE